MYNKNNVTLSDEIAHRLYNTSNVYSSLFESYESITSIKTKPRNKTKINFDNIPENHNFYNIIEEVPQGIYHDVNTLVNKLTEIYENNKTSGHKYSPISVTYEDFEPCKKLSYSKSTNISGRDKEIEKIMLTLCRKNKKGVILVGDPGVGKTVIVRELNSRIINGNVPFALKGCKIHHLDMPYMISNHKEDTGSRVIDILETASTDPKHIIFIDEIHSLLTEKFNDVLKPYLTEDIRFIGSTTVEEYHNIVSEDAAIERRFTIIKIDEPTIEETTSMMEKSKISYEKYFSCIITKDICSYIVENSARFLGHRKNPDKAFDILDKACAIFASEIEYEYDTDNSDSEFSEFYHDINVIKSEKIKSKDSVLTKKHVNMAISDIANIDYDFIKNSLDYKVINEKLNDFIFDQEKAISEISNAANVIKHVKHNRTRPTMISLLVGGKGVGKTSSVKKLSELLYGSTKNYIEYDLAEFKSDFQLTEIKGAPPGYVGYKKSGKLIKELKNNPQSIVLFKNVNKCNTVILEYITSSIMSGSFIDSAEREVKLTNAIIFFSVTLSDDDEKNINKTGIGFNTSTNTEKNIEKIVDKDLINIVDNVIYYDNLKKETLFKIFDKEYNEIVQSYKDVELNKDEIRNLIFAEDIKSGHELITKIMSVIPKTIFEKLKG